MKFLYTLEGSLYEGWYWGTGGGQIIAAQLSGIISIACLANGRPKPKNWAAVRPKDGVGNVIIDFVVIVSEIFCWS